MGQTVPARPSMMRTDEERELARAPEIKASDGAFDIWLKRGLHERYDAMLQESVPQEHLELIRTPCRTGLCEDLSPYGSRCSTSDTQIRDSRTEHED